MNTPDFTLFRMLDNVEKDNPSRADASKIPIADYVWDYVKKTGRFRDLIDRYAASNAWIIPYNLAGTCSEHESLPLKRFEDLCILIGNSRHLDDLDMTIAFTAGLKSLLFDAHEAFGPSDAIFRLIKCGLTDSGPGSQWKHTQVADLLLHMHDKHVLKLVFNREQIEELCAIANALAHSSAISEIKELGRILSN